MSLYRYLIGGTVLLAFLAGAYGYHVRVVGKLQREVKSAQDEAAYERRKSTQFQIDIATLGAALVKQNEATKRAQAEASAAEKRAGQSAREVIARGARERQQILTAPGVGPDSLNVWLCAAFGC